MTKTIGLNLFVGLQDMGVQTSSSKVKGSSDKKLPEMVEKSFNFSSQIKSSSASKASLLKTNAMNKAPSQGLDVKDLEDDKNNKTKKAPSLKVKPAVYEKNVSESASLQNSINNITEGMNGNFVLPEILNTIASGNFQPPSDLNGKEDILDRSRENGVLDNMPKRLLIDKPEEHKGSESTKVVKGEFDLKSMMDSGKVVVQLKPEPIAQNSLKTEMNNLLSLQTLPNEPVQISDIKNEVSVLKTDGLNLVKTEIDTTKSPSLLNQEGLQLKSSISEFSGNFSSNNGEQGTFGKKGSSQGTFGGINNEQTSTKNLGNPQSGLKPISSMQDNVVEGGNETGQFQSNSEGKIGQLNNASSSMNNTNNPNNNFATGGMGSLKNVQGATPNVGAPDINRTEVLQKLAQELSGAIQSKTNDFTIKLTPYEKELGSINIQMKLTNKGKIQAHFKTDEESAYDLLKSSTLELEEILQGIGVSTDPDSFSFSYASQNQESFEGGQNGYAQEQSTIGSIQEIANTLKPLDSLERKAELKGFSSNSKIDIYA